MPAPADNDPGYDIIPPANGTTLPKITKESVSADALLRNPLVWFIGGMVFMRWLDRNFRDH